RSSCLESGTNTVFHRNITHVVVLIEQLLVSLVLLSGDVQQENTRENDQEPHNQADGVLRTGVVVVSEQNERGNQSGCGECDVVQWVDNGRVKLIQGFVEVVHLGHDADNDDD
ncbi:hypothetical protein WICPIJ_006162, partial [Wickerhamomyces pijperi]